MTIVKAAQMLVEKTATARTQWISEGPDGRDGLTQFGANIETLMPGAVSALKHWHSAEDEMVYVLAGTVTVHEGERMTVLQPGDAAIFRAGDPVGHFLENRSSAPTRCLIVGTRAPVDCITYPDHDRICLRDRSLPDDLWTTGAGEAADCPY